jgi:hypothetical protein
VIADKRPGFQTLTLGTQLILNQASTFGYKGELWQAYVLYSSMVNVDERNKEIYYLAHRQMQGTIRSESPNGQPWLTLFLRCLSEQARRLEEKVEHKKLV